MFTAALSSGSNLFKTYVKTYADLATNSGTAQSYSTNATGVTLATDTAPTFLFSPVKQRLHQHEHHQH